MTPKLYRKIENAVMLKELENLKSDLENAKAIIEYISMMTDVEIPTEDEMEAHDYE